MSSSPFDKFFENNLFEKCKDNEKEDFKILNCVLGFSEFTLSLLMLLFTIIGLVKMIKYYDKLNFEISLLFFSIFQIILIDLIIITPHDFLYEIFFLIQIFLISLIIRKFVKITKKKIFNENVIFIIVNIINLIIFTFYILSLLDVFLSDIYLCFRFISRIFYFLITIYLTVLCCSLIKKLEKFEKNNESYDLFLRKKSTIGSAKSEHFTVSFYSQELFFMIRKKQITPLYILNLSCSFFQLLFILSKNFLFTDLFKKIEYKLESENEGYIIYYIYLLTFFLNTMINFICFYWVIRDQYKDNSNRTVKTRPYDTILDDKFILKESQAKEGENNEAIFSANEIRKKIKIKKSLYRSTFNDEDDDKENPENYFVKNNDNNNNKIKEDINTNFDKNSSSRETITSKDAINNSNVYNINISNND